LRLLIVLVILIVVTVPVIRSGFTLPDTITFFLGVSAAGTQAVRPLAALNAGGSN
jgi:hypothetical protein